MELQIVQALLGLLSLLASAGVAYLSPHLKAWFKGRIAAFVIDTLGKIAENVVADFNQRVVSDAKKQGVFNAQLATTVKNDAIAAVKSQASSVIALGNKFVGDMQGQIGAAIEKAVVNQNIA